MTRTVLASLVVACLSVGPLACDDGEETDADGDGDGDVDSDADGDGDGDADGDGTDPCEVDDCVHGECVVQGGYPICNCEEGWTGVLCDEVDPCFGYGCQNGGTCVPDGSGGASCDCPAGFEGDFCETNIDDCTASPCLHGGTCVDGVDGFVCDCSAAPGWQGNLCDEDFPDCASEPCEHGTCIEGTAGSGEYTCECDEGWEGVRCGLVTDLCTPNPCQHGGTCAMGDPGEHSCECAAGYEGDHCETNIDDCASEPCLNGGTCVDGVATFTCNCLSGYSGATCADVVTGCSDNPCLHATDCIDMGPGEYECVCEDGWEGINCGTNIDDCAESPCQHGGTCIDEVAGYRCDCSTTDGWEGTNCETMTDLCTPNPCQHDGVCGMVGPGEYECDCVGGYSGTDCEVAPETTHCALTYDLVVGNGNNGSGYTGSNIRIRDTFLGLGNGTYAVGPGILILRVPSDGGTSPAPGTAEILYYELAQEFVTSTSGITITTDVDAFSPTLGATDNDVAQATGVLSLGATPTIAWGACDYPPGYNDSTTSFDPDVEGDGPGCLDPYRSVGVVNCLDESWLASCADGDLDDGDNPQDETWEQAMQTLTFTSGLASFSMPFMLVPDRSDARTYLSWGGTLASTVCE